MNIKIIIPTRLNSSRFPKKPLAKIQHKEMILHVCDRASKVYPVIVATPDTEIKELVEKHGYEAVLTSKDCLTGTDRVAEVAKYINADIYVNVQGDEPLIPPAICAGVRGRNLVARTISSRFAISRNARPTYRSLEPFW